MELLIILTTIATWIAAGTSGNPVPEDMDNSTDPNKDMYVIHAMVYQVGILTNKTDEDSYANSTGNEEALTLYHTNGSNIDLSNIPTPLLTNITAQRFVGVAPSLGATSDAANKTTLAWSTLDQLASLEAANTGTLPEKARNRRQITTDADDQNDEEDYDYGHSSSTDRLFKRSLVKRGIDEEKNPVKFVKGTAIIPEEAAVQSIAIPPLLTLNNNLSEIPVPIPNTSVVHYSKINTLVQGAMN